MTNVEQPSATFRNVASSDDLLSSGYGTLPLASALLAAFKPSTFVQLGVGTGETYFSFCHLLNEPGQPCSTYVVDTLPTAAFEQLATLNRAHIQNSSYLLQKGFDEALADFNDESIALLLINLINPYPSLRRVFDSWLAKVQPNGILLIDNLADSEVSQLWNEVSKRHPSFSLSGNKAWGLLTKSPHTLDHLSFLRHSEFDEKRSETSWFQVYRWQQSEYRTTADFSHAVPFKTWVNLQIKLPQGTGTKPLRFDVSDRTAVVDIATIALRKEDGHTVWAWNSKETPEQIQAAGTATRLPEPEFFRVLALGDSPHMFLPELTGEAFEEPLELEVRLRVDPELAALKELAQKLPGEGNLSTAALESAVTKAKVDSARYLAQSRLEHDTKVRQINAEADARVAVMRSELESLRAELETAHATHQNSLSQQLALFVEERRSHQVTALERENLQTAHSHMLQEVSIAQGNVEELKAEVERLNGEMASMEYDLAEVRKINARLAATLEEERKARANMQESGSWQLTKPLRAVGDLFGPRRKY